MGAYAQYSPDFNQDYKLENIVSNYIGEYPAGKKYDTLSPVYFDRLHNYSIGIVL
jgi:hypothetical protein